MPNSTDERNPRKAAPAPTVLAPAAPTTPATPLPSVGGKSTTTAKFTPKYLPRLINYQLPEYQEEYWRE